MFILMHTNTKESVNVRFYEQPIEGAPKKNLSEGPVQICILTLQ